jgi:hypothetical protein
MSQKPANSRENGGDATASRENATADSVGEGATARRLPSPNPASGAAGHVNKLSNASAGQNTPATMKGAVATQSQRSQGLGRSSAGPVRAVAANDDMPSIGGLIFALQQRPSKSPFYLALAASAVWFVLGCLIAWAVIARNAQGISSFADLFTTPSIVAAIATIIVPIALFWFLAILVWRAQELRLMSSAMTEVAVRLAEPDKMAEQSVASLGQTVRRQVAAMNDAISRALGRAGELEALVHNEVAALERSYSENENRIRNLISELASEREALANNSDRVSEALRGIGSHVTREISAASERASNAMSQATSTLADTLASRGNKITAAVTAAGAVIDEKLAERGSRITEQLVKHGAQAAEKLHQSGLEVTRAIQETSDRTAAAISAKGNNLVASVMSMSERVGREIPVLLERLGGEQTRLSGIIEGAAKNLAALESALAKRTDSLGVQTKNLEDVLGNHARHVDESLAERTQALEAILGRRTQAFELALSERTKNLDASVARYTGNIRETLEQHSHAMETSLSQQANSIHTVVTGTANQIQRAVDELVSRSGSSAESLTTNAQMLKEVSSGLLGQIHMLTKRFEDQGANIMNSARALEMQNTKVDAVIEARQTSLNKLLENLNGRAGELDRMMNNYTSMLEQSLGQAEGRARQVTEMLARDSADKSQTAMKDLERLRAEAQAHTSRAIMELQTSFRKLSEQVAQQLSGFATGFNETTRQVRDQTHQAVTELENTQTELRRQAKALPETTKQSAGAMRKAVQDQLSALEQLTDLAARHGHQGQISRPTEQPRQAPPVHTPQPPQQQRVQPQHVPQPPQQHAPLTPHTPHIQQHASHPLVPHSSHPKTPPLPEKFDMPKPVEKARREPTLPPPPPPPPIGAGFGDSWGAPHDSFEAVSAGVMERMDNVRGPDFEPMGRPPVQTTPTAAAPDASLDRRSGQWSLGDLLARASQLDDDPYDDSDDSFGMPPIAPPPLSLQQEPPRKVETSIFDMKDIAAAVDETTAGEVWARYHKGDRHAISRSIYSRQGLATYDQVRRRYESDITFRHIVDRYLADFERMLQDSGKGDPKGRTMQAHLTSETGRIYLVLGHASGRLLS